MLGNRATESEFSPPLISPPRSQDFLGQAEGEGRFLSVFCTFFLCEPQL